MNRPFTFLVLLLVCAMQCIAQADNEIQVYASPTIRHRWTIIELHSNYTPKGSRHLPDPQSARWLNETVEVTTGIAKNMELGFYMFTAVAPDGSVQYLGNQVRPRVTVPESWKWKFGASLSLEFGFFRPHRDSSFEWQGELRPIADKTIGNWYFAFNPNIDFVLTGPGRSAGLSPQVKVVHTFKEVFGFGIEYYGAPGTFGNWLPAPQQEHLLGPMIDLYLHPRWEINGGVLFGLTGYSNQKVIKLLLGRRMGRG
ncbi:MAG TPA: hypothetical protein VFZ78_05155 [Flavisolibacter sp.]